MLRQIEWGVQNGPITKNGVLSVTTLFLIKVRNKNGTEVTLEISSTIVGDSNDKNNFPNKLLLSNTQVSGLRKAFFS